MKICWDNLEKLKYDPGIKAFRNKKSIIFFEVGSCALCGEPFIGSAGKENKYCSHACANTTKKLPFGERTDRIRKKSLQYYYDHLIDRRLFSVRHRAETLGLPYDLDKEWYLSGIEKGCAMTGIPFELNHGLNHGRSAKHPSIDRIDSKKGYTKANCRMVLNIMNFWKLDYVDDQLYEVAKAFVEKYENDRPD